MSEHAPERQRASRGRVILVAALLAVVAVVAAVALTLVLAGRDGSPAPAPAVAATATTKPATTGICMAAVSAGVVVNEWSLVMASIGEADHEERIKAFIKFVDDDADRAHTDGCESNYAVEITELAYQASLLRVLIIAGNAQSADYAKVASAGQAWVDKIGRSDLMFSGSSL